MKKTFLMPHWCKIAGWVVMLPLGVFGIVQLFRKESVLELFVIPGIYTTLLSVSMLMVAFSRERDEDEYTAAVRSKYLMLAFYIDAAFLAVTAFTVHDFAYLNIMSVQMFLILLLHIVMFNTAMAVIRRRRSREQ